MNEEPMRTWILVVLVAACVLAGALAVYAWHSPGGGNAAAVASRSTVPTPMRSRPHRPNSSTPVPVRAALVCSFAVHAAVLR